VLRSVAAVAAGFVFMWSTVFVGGIVFGPRFVPRLAAWAFGGLLGGWLAARFAPHSGLRHAVALAFVVAGIATASFRAAPAGSAPPLGPSLAATAVAMACILAGGWLRASAGAPRT